MRVLVTGGAGFIGSHLVDRLLAEGFEVVVLDNLCSGRLENIKQYLGKSSFRFVCGDVRDSVLVNSLVKNVDVIFHLAALVSVPESFMNPFVFNDVNVGGTLVLLKACVDAGVKRFVYASSCAVYGEAEGLPIREDSPLKPISPYGVSKLAAENYVRVFHENFKLETVCLRFFNVYGPRQTEGDYSGVIVKFLSYLKKNQPLTIFGAGEQTRDFVYVSDIVEACVLAMKSSEAIGKTFNVGSGKATTINELAKTLIKIANKNNIKITHSKPREGDIRHSFADISKAREKLGYNPKFSLEEGLRKLLGKI